MSSMSASLTEAPPQAWLIWSVTLMAITSLLCRSADFPPISTITGSPFSPADKTCCKSQAHRKRPVTMMICTGRWADHRHSHRQHSLQHGCWRPHVCTQRALHPAHPHSTPLPQLPTPGRPRVLRDRNLPAPQRQERGQASCSLFNHPPKHCRTVTLSPAQLLSTACSDRLTAEWPFVS